MGGVRLSRFYEHLGAFTQQARPSHHERGNGWTVATLAFPLKAKGPGSGVNGGELLFLALATCYCNDIYREAKKRGIEIVAVRVETSGEFGGAGEPARSIRYRATVDAKASREATLDLMRYTDTVAEIHNTLRLGMPVVLTDCEANEV